MLERLAPDPEPAPAPIPIHKRDDYKKINPFGRGAYYVLKTDTKQRLSEADYNAIPETGAAQPTEREPRLFKSGGVLSKAEAADLYEPLLDALKDEFGYLDELIWLRATQVKGRDIWGNVDDEEVQTLAKMMLKKGQKSPAMATVVRGMTELHDYLVVGMMFGPRLQETHIALRDAPRAPKRERPRSLFRRD